MSETPDHADHADFNDNPAHGEVFSSPRAGSTTGPADADGPDSLAEALPEATPESAQGEDASAEAAEDAVDDADGGSPDKPSGD